MNNESASFLSLENRYLFFLVLLLAVACIWVTPFPPLVDLPQHAAQVLSLQEISNGNPAYTNTFELNWFAPYTATYLLMYLLALIMPVSAAAKVLVTLAVAGVPLICGPLFAALGAFRGWQWLTLPVGFGVAFYWGFLPFMLAVPIGLLLLLLTVQLVRAPSVRLGIGIAAVTVLLFFLHVIALGFVGLLCVSYIAVACRREPQTIVRLWLPFTIGLPLLLYWYLATLGSETYVQGAAVVYGPLLDRLLSLLSAPAGLGGYVVYPSVLLVAGLLAYPWLSGATLSARPERRALPLIGLLVLMAMPATAFGSILLYQRLTIFLLPLWLLAWQYPAGHRPRWQGGIMALVVLLALINLARFAGFGTEMRNLAAVLDGMDEQRTLMYFPVVPVTAGFSEPVHFHSGAWYQAEKRGIVDFNFAFFFPSMVRFREGQHSWVPNDSVVWQPLAFDWERGNGEFYDYFLVRAPEDLAGPVFKGSAAQVELVNRQGWWWLYKNKNAAD